MARAMQHPTRSAGVRHKSEKRSMFPRAVGVGGKRSTIESERNAPNARVRTMRTSATTDVSRVHARARACTADGTHLGLRPNRPFELQAPRPTGAGVDANPNSRCVASYVPVFAAGSAVPLTVSRDVLCSRPTRCRPAAPADTTQCDAHIMPRVRQRRPKSAVCAVRVRVVAWHGLQAEGGARGRCRRPHLRHRRVVRGELALSLCGLARRFPAPIRADSVCGQSASLRAAQRYPLLFVMVWSAPPTSSATADSVEPFHAAQCSAVDLPDGAGAIGTVGDRRGRRTGRGEWAHPPLFLVFTSARATTSCSTIA
jgi:hypothetical protein